MGLINHLIIQKLPMHKLKIPYRFNFKYHNDYDFSYVLKNFDWELFNKNNALINIKYCERANYQTMALLVLYVWYLKVNGCHIDIIQSRLRVGATKMWNLWVLKVGIGFSIIRKSIL